MEEGKTFKNFAFISYSHADKKAAEELQKVLDDFHLSDALKEKYPDRPEVLREIFRDDTGLPAGSNLTKEIQKQLEQSNYLIVICSPNAAKSEWVNKEIDYFKTHREPTHIIPFIIDGVANAKSADEQECFPDALKSLEARGANISTFSFERAVIEVIAGALEIDVDDLWQRHVRAEEAKKRQLQEQRDNLLRVQSLFLAEKANALVEEGDSYTARLLALEALPKDLENPDRPYVIESEVALRKALQSNSAIFNGHKDKVISIALSTDGHTVASASFDGSIRLWDIRTGHTIQELPIKESSLSDISFSSDSQHIAYAYTNNEDFSIYIWNLIKNCHQCVLKGHQGVIRSISFSHDGLSLITASDDGTVRVWDVSKGKCRKILHDDGKFVISAVLSPNEGYMASASADNTIRIWDAAKGVLIKKLEGHTDVVTNVAFSGDGSMLASTSEDCTIRIWDTVTWQCVRCLKGHQRFVLSAAFSPNNLFLVSGSLDNTIRIWELEEGRCLGVLNGHTNRVNKVLFHQEGHLVISASDDSTVRIWELWGDEPISVSLHDVSYFRSSSISTKGTLIAGVDGYSEICVKEKESGSILHKGIGHKDDVCDICFSPDDKYIASASYDKTIRIWEASTLECKHVLKGHSNVVMSVSFSPDGKCIVSTSLDDTIRVWDVLTGLCVFVIDNKFQSASYFTTDGSHIVSNISDNRADIWEFLPIQNLIDQTRERFNNRPLTPEERKKYYLD
jgi:WD40 repeat protein